MCATQTHTTVASKMSSTSSHIPLKDAAAIEKMRLAGKLAAAVLDMVEEHVQAGISTEELDRICHHHIVQNQQATPAPLGYRGYPKSICTSINHQVCHGIPGPRKLQKGDIINIDITVIKDGYHGDTSRMFCVGQPTPLAKRLCDVSYACMCHGIRGIAAGVRLGDIGAAIQHHAEVNRFSVVREYGGHGIGLGFHEPPHVPNYGIAGQGLVLQAGMIITVEPMINAGRRHVRLLGDKWTVITHDRSLSAQWEHTVLVTDDGFEVLTLSAGTTL